MRKLTFLIAGAASLLIAPPVTFAKPAYLEKPVFAQVPQSKSDLNVRKIVSNAKAEGFKSQVASLSRSGRF